MRVELKGEPPPAPKQWQPVNLLHTRNRIELAHLAVFGLEF